jgi:phosphonoacetate hydrolase
MRDTSRTIDRRTFLGGATAAVLGAGVGHLSPLSAQQARPWSDGRKVLFITVDGFGPEYLRVSDMPNLKRIAAAGVLAEGECVIPSLTNVNNASVITASFPADHGITGNYYYDRRTGAGTFMESEEFLLRPTILEEAVRRGLRTGFVTSKAKLMFLGRGATLADSAEAPATELASVIGPAQDVYSAEINYWCFRSARYLLGERDFDLVYLATTDYMMHTYPPGDERSLAHLRQVDDLLGQILNDHERLEVYLTADHGMSAKRDAIDIGRIMNGRGIRGEAVPVIRDRYVAHHSNLGGACYVYLEEERDVERTFDLLRELPGVEEIFLKADAAREFRLHADRIGDIFLLGEQSVVFGSLPQDREEVDIRSHGSRHERVIPVIAYGRSFDPSLYRRNVDLTRNFDWEA